ncbi:heavy metal translocating P-type ATPase [Helicobacter sp.]|uniref:heavy metal translocating P-type ATPase n=1 Tax=Helicobacter sp. TaxID=218 RepID=UPI0025BB1192|nr:heavy metal translocating P-type ATPase [Helicobacter sp.]MCI5968227.1 heavy metal translocating P-type ATPase [Helicobacter sp.]MDY2584923.1 heavy metal translocating P-type ATPase [Helicobacter sp.]
MQCSHCHLEFDAKALLKVSIDGRDEYFCCRGCEGVYKLLHTEGLEDFYNKLGENTLEPIKDSKQSLDSFDSIPFFERYVREKDTYCELALVLERIHCIACVWLNEKILAKTRGIIKVNINYTSNKATLLYNPKIIKISEIIQAIRSIGYNAHAYDPHLQESYAQKEKREYYIKMVVGIFCVMNIMWIAVAQYAGYFSGITPQMRNVLNFASFVLATPVLFFSGIVFWRSAISALKHRTPNMDLLVISGASLTYLYSIYASFKGGETYFESVAMIVTFVLIGKFLEVRGKKSAVDSLDKLNAQMPLSVRVVEHKSNREEIKEVRVESVKVGDVVQVLAGDRVALDGILLSENALCDESAINGESLPLQKSKKDSIYSGALALEMPFLYRVSKTYKESLMMQIVSLVEDALNARPKIQEMANCITRYFSAVVLSLAFGAFLYWEFVLNVAFDRALMVMVSVIIIACPCALALATPIASLVGLGEALKYRILFKEASFLETIAKANVLVLDKTGTLTEGKLKVQEMRKFGKLDDSVLVAMLEQSAHPISRGVLAFIKANSKKVEKVALDKITQKNARGILAQCNGSVYLGGNLELLREQGVRIPQLDESDCSVFYFAKDTELIAQFFLQDSIKQDAKAVISKLQKKGISCVLLSGDHLRACESVAKELGIVEFYGNQSPLDKAEFIDKLHQQEKIVVMVGDGINDSIALGKSDIGIAMGGGMDLAISVSDVVVLDDSIQGVLESFKLGRRTYRFILQNLGLSLLYNALTIPLAMAGFVIPLIAALSMSLSSLLVVGNSLRIKGE